MRRTAHVPHLQRLLPKVSYRYREVLRAKHPWEVWHQSVYIWQDYEENPQLPAGIPWLLLHLQHP